MKHALKNSIQENMHGLLECMFVRYANLLRSKYPDKTIRNADVFTSGVKEFARLDYIELVDARTGIPDGLPAFLVRTIKRAKPPIWIPGPNFPDEPWEIDDLMNRQCAATRWSGSIFHLNVAAPGVTGSRESEDNSAAEFFIPNVVSIAAHCVPQDLLLTVFVFQASRPVCRTMVK